MVEREESFAGKFAGDGDGEAFPVVVEERESIWRWLSENSREFLGIFLGGESDSGGCE